MQTEDVQTNAPPMISVVIPTFNRKAVLERCLKALARQTYADFEVVVVDDGSSDGTPRFLEDFGKKHPKLRLRCIENEKNMGANPSRNVGIRAAEGAIVAFLDSDCIAAGDWLERLSAGFVGPDVAAVAGRVDNPQPGNVFELMVAGTSRVSGGSHASRLVAGNMAIRREVLLAHPLDEDLKYGCDEEGIYLRLKAAGFQQRFVPDAVVLHEHYYTGRSLLRQARVGGAAAAWLVFKYHLSPRLDLLPFFLAYITLPLVLVYQRLAIVPICFAAAAVVALAYNELCRKQKTVGQMIECFPVLLVYYHVRLVAYAMEAFALRFGDRRKIQRIKLGEYGANATDAKSA